MPTDSHASPTETAADDPVASRTEELYHHNCGHSGITGAKHWHTADADEMESPRTLGDGQAAREPKICKDGHLEGVDCETDQGRCQAAADKGPLENLALPPSLHRR